MTSQPGKRTVAIHILPNISRSKCIQAMKFVQLIKSNMKNIFLEKLYSKFGWETISKPNPAWKNKIEYVSGSIA